MRTVIANIRTDYSLFIFYKGNIQNSTVLGPLSTNKPNTTDQLSINDSFRILNAKSGNKGFYFDYF
jgi:hypothetical protein